jgi:AraC-like DNA-binding protein
MILPPSSSENVIDNMHVRLFTARVLTLEKLRWSSQGLLNSYWRFYCNSSDGAFLQLSSGLYPLSAGRIYFVPAGVKFSCYNPQTVRHFYIHFDLIGLPAWTLREIFSGPLAVPPNPTLQKAAKQLGAALQKSGHTDLAIQCRLKSLIYQSLATFLETLPPEQLLHCAQMTTAQGGLLPALRYIEENIGQRLTNHQLAALCHLSEDYFVRQFRQSIGQTPLQYITERRVTLAAQRLLFSEESIEQVATATGFGNRFYFSRIFTRQTGISPAAYRKATRI